MRIFARLMIFAAVSSLGAYAQHGGGHGGGAGGGMGRPAGAGNSGGGSGMEIGPPSGRTTGRPENTSGSDIGKPSPSDILSRNTHLSSNLEKVLPQGMTAQQACAGFSNLGKCVSAAHVSQNLGIPFSDLKAKITGTGAESLGKAIDQLKPDANSKSAIKKAKRQTKNDLSGVSQ